MHTTPACVTVKVWPPIVSVPLRCVVLALAAALNPTVPPPLPLAPVVTVNHDVLLLTPVHAHPVGAVTVVEPVPPPAATDWFGCEIAYVQGVAACVTENVWPAIVSEPFRCVPLGLAATLKPTVPAPLPLAPLVTVNHDVLLLTPVHAQPANVVTDVEPVPPLAAAEWLAGNSANVQDVAACVTENVWLPMVMVPVRELVIGFDEALNATVPSPLPLPPLVTVSHDGVLLTAVQAHPVATVTVVEPVPPPAATDWPVGDRL